MRKGSPGRQSPKTRSNVSGTTTRTPVTTTGRICMAFNRADVVLVPFPYTNLSATKVRPAIVISSNAYHSTEPDLLLAAITSRVSAATGPLDYVLNDWQAAGLRYPSAF